ncbi:MAG: tRNA (cytidine(34)-2'-O)-methyltransferase [Candidatus Eremiobacteraeota bacterium]|nr:tRNA (cytidine(34)-2'-O)-methyltransferase [Candidatus Eremiobacteraeota bacterium]
MQPPQRIVNTKQVENAPLHIVLVEPLIPPNTGNVARLCAATGCALHLVEPLGFSIDDRELKRAGLDYWEHVALVVHPSLEAYLAESGHQRRWYVETDGAMRYDEAPYALGDALVFGRETSGLPRELVARERDRTVRVPIRAGTVRSLNLSTTVGIVAYAALARLGFPSC